MEYWVKLAYVMVTTTTQKLLHKINVTSTVSLVLTTVSVHVSHAKNTAVRHLKWQSVDIVNAGLIL